MIMGRVGALTWTLESQKALVEVALGEDMGTGGQLGIVP